MTTEHLSSLADLFCPDFVVVGDAVLRKEAYEPLNFQRWIDETGGDTQAVEATLNHVHLYDIVDEDDPNLEALRSALARIQICWAAILKERFPERSFRLVASDEPDDYGPTLTFFQTTRCS